MKVTKIKIRLELLRILREDRVREYTPGDLENALKERGFDVSREEIERELEQYVHNGVVFNRYIGDTRDKVYLRYSLTKRKDEVNESTNMIPGLEEIERSWLERENVKWEIFA
jgi:hypothetical protein